MEDRIKSLFPAIMTAIVTITGSFFVFQVDYKKTDNDLVHINAENFQKLYDYQSKQIKILTKRVDSLATDNNRLREEVMRLKIAYYNKDDENETYNFLLATD